MSLPGLSHFSMQNPTMAKHWSSWPHLNLASDQGSDMLSAMHALLYHEPTKCNITPFYDPSHGVNRDFWLSVTEMGLKPFMLLAMIVINLPHGPDESDTRYNQLKEIMTNHYQHVSPKLSPIFQTLSAPILREIEHDMVVEEGQSQEEAAWAHLQQEMCYKKKGYKCNIGRFCGVIHAGAALCKRWHATLFEVVVPCIELGMLTQVAMPKISLGLVGADDASNQDSTSAKVVSVGDRTLRTCGVNAVVISLAVLADISHYRLLSIITSLAAPSMHFHGATSRALRGAKESQEWLVEMCRTGASEHVMETMVLLSQESFNEFTLFATPGLTQDATKMSEHEIAYEDQLAAYAGGFAFQMCRNRLRRMLYLTQSYPHLCVLLLGTPSEQGDLFTTFKKDLENFNALQIQENKTTIMKTYIERSPFQLLSVKQLADACQAMGWASGPELIKLVSARTTTVMSSQGVEDMNNFQKNSRQLTSWGGRYRRPQTSLACTVRGRMLETVHNYEVLKHPKVPTNVQPLEKHDMCTLRFGVKKVFKLVLPPAPYPPFPRPPPAFPARGEWRWREG